MNDQIQERMDIINSYKSYINWGNKPERTQKRFLLFFIVIEFLGLPFLLFITYISVMTILKIEPEYSRWDETGLLVLIVIGMTLKAPLIIKEFILKNHKKKIKDLNITFNEKTNADLKEIICGKKTTVKRLVVFVIPSTIIFISAFLQQIDLNPFWDIFAFVIPIFTLYFLTLVYFEIRKLKKNFAQVEAEIKTDK